MKTLDEKLKKKNKGLVSVEFGEPLTTDMPEMDIVEAPSGDLPAKLEDDGKKPKDTWDYLDYRVDQANKHERYIPLLKKDIDDVLNNHDFVEEHGYYSRIRGDKADYLFLENFVDKKKKGTYWVTLDYDESKGFEKMLNDYIKRNDQVANYWGKDSTRAFGPLLLGIAGGAFIGFSIGDLLSDYIGGAGAVMGIVSGVVSWLGIFTGITHLDRSYLKKKAEKAHDEIMEGYGEEIKSKDKKYDLDVIKHYLRLTPKQLLDKQFKRSIDSNKYGGTNAQ